MNAHFIRKEQVADSIWAFWFKPEEKLSYQAGQAIDMYLDHENPDDRGTKRWMTLSSSPSESLIAITTKISTRSSSFKHTLQHLSVGARIQLGQPVGAFVLPKQANKPLVCIAAGVGIAPMRSMVQSAKDAGEQREIYLFYTAPRTADFAYRSLFSNYCSLVKLYPTREPSTSEKCSATAIITHLDQAVSEKGLFYIAGPEEFVIDMTNQLIVEGIKQRTIITDPYHGYET